MGDLISRQNAIRWVKTECNPYGKPTLDYESGVKVINHLEKMQSEPQWIPCSERLPEKFGNYLVSVKRHGWNCEEHIENDIAYWDDLEGFHKVDEVLAWMPLPEPYKEGENG